MNKKIQAVANLFFLSACESLLFILWLMLIPRENTGSFLFGFSMNRLIILRIIILGAGTFICLHFLLKKQKNFQNWIFDIRNQSRFLTWLLSISLLVALGSWSAIFLFHFLKIPWISIDLHIRLLPFLFWLLVISLQFLFFLPLIFFPKKNTIQHHPTLLLKSFVIVFLISIILFSIVIITKLGINTEVVGVNDLGVPLLEGQIWFCIGILSIIIWWSKVISPHLDISIPKSKIIQFINSDCFIFICIWGLTILFWISQPLPSRNYFAPIKVPPNNEIYPFSDAASYDLDAYKVIYGASAGQTIPKTLYVTFLACLHLLGGNDYGTIIFLQTIVLALFPAILYWIGRELDHRHLGIGLALFSIFRELNSIQAVDVANVSNSKLLLSDMPTMLGVSVLVLVLIKWLKEQEWQPSHAWWIGGTIGLLLLIRFQILLLIPLILLFAVIKYYRKWKQIFLFCLLVLFVVGIVILPALIRNYLIDGTFWLEKSSYFGYITRLMTSSYNPELSLEMDNFNSVQIQQFFTFIEEYIRKNGIGFLAFIPDHFFRNIISAFLIFPVRVSHVATFEDFLSVDNPFWLSVPLNLTIFEFIIITINLVIISFGIVFLYKKNSAVCIFLIVLFTIYDLSTAIIRLSGWRFILPVDWIFILFYGMGILSVMRWIVARIYPVEETEKERPTTIQKSNLFIMRNSKYMIAVISFLVMIIAAFIPIRELLSSKNYPEISKGQVCEEITNTSEFANSGINADQFLAKCKGVDTIVLKGKAFYPRFIEKNFGFKNRGGDIYFGRQDFSRLVFYLMTSGTPKILMRMTQPPDFFPNGADVVVVGQQGDYFEAGLILVQSKGIVKIIKN